MTFNRHVAEIEAARALPLNQPGQACTDASDLWDVTYAHPIGIQCSQSTQTEHQQLQHKEVSVPVEAAGTPGESGNPKVATPDPACTRKESAWP